jgi:PAS domain S-box-containing protein
MSWVTVIFSMTSSACLTMAWIHGFIWLRKRDAWANLLFMLAAVGTAALAWSELAMTRAESVSQFASAILWARLSICVIILSLAGFVRLYLRAGRIWLLWTVCGLRIFYLCSTVLSGQTATFHEAAGIRTVPFLGERITVQAVTAPHPWGLLGQLSVWVLMIYVADAAIAVWRRGDRRLASVVCGSILLFLLPMAGHTALIVLSILPPPGAASLFYLGIIAAMGYELAGAPLRAAQLERDLRARDEQIALAAEAANLGFAFWQFARNEIRATDHWRALLGFEKSEALHIDDFFLRLHPDDHEKVRRTLQHMKPGNSHYQTQYRVLLPDGRMRWIACQGSMEFSHGGQPDRLLSVSLDITAHKQADVEAQMHRNEIAHLMRVASLGEFSSAIVHELGQPLTSILANAQAARRLLQRDNPDVGEFQEILGDIVAADKRAGEIIHRLSALMKKGEFQPQRLEANELIESVLRTMNYDLMVHSVSVVRELNADLPSIYGDGVQLQQVLINLILNASDAMARVARNARKLTIRSSRADSNFIEISVADTGTGIAPGDEERIFTPYHTTKPQGLGLGLSVSRTIIRAHGGRLWAENRASGSATFHVAIPQWDGSASRSA